MAAIPLCVPYARKNEAKKAGARWNKTLQVWTCRPELLSTNAYSQLRPFLPRMYRPDIQPPYIRPWMVPQTLWGKNLRAVLQEEQWDIVRKHAYVASGYRCQVCGGRGPGWPVEADEAWNYDDKTLIQTLKAVIALCPDCHRIRHWGKTTIDGREKEALARLMTVNRWSRAQAEAEIASAFKQWDERSRYEWTSDYGWVTRVHGFVPSEEGEQRAIAANRALITQTNEAAELIDRQLSSSPSSDIENSVHAERFSWSTGSDLVGALLSKVRSLIRLRP
jgi:Domain of unknown function (DUF5710)